MLKAARVAVSQHFRGVLLAATLAVAAVFLAERYGAPAMLFALLLGIAFNFLATHESCRSGVEFSAKALLRLGVALLGIRLSLGDVVALGFGPALSVAGLVGLTLLVGVLLARLVGKSSALGVLTGGAVGICGASAALAIAAILPKSRISERDTLFTVVGVTTLSTVAMVLYPVLTRLLGFDEVATGLLIGATIHDVAQVVGAGYSVSEQAGDVATLVKLQRVALLPVVLFALILLGRREGGGGLNLPWFLVAFVALVALNSTGVVPAWLQTALAEASRWMLVVAIAALGVKTSLTAMFEVGPRHAFVIVGTTLVLLLAGIGLVALLAG